MKIFKFAVSFLFFTSVFTAGAADVSLGIRAGGNYNFDTIFAGDYEGLAKNSDLPLGFEGAVVGQFDLISLGKAKIGLIADAGFEYLNGVHADKQILRNTWSESGLGKSTYDKVESIEVNGMAVEFAPLLSCSIPVSNSIKIVPFAGPVISYNLMVQEKSTIQHYEKDGDLPEDLVSTTKSVADVDNFLSYGAQFGFYTAFEVGKGSFICDLRYGFDFMSDGLYRKGNATLSVGYMLNLFRGKEKSAPVAKKETVEKVNPDSKEEVSPAVSPVNENNNEIKTDSKSPSLTISVNNYFTPDDDGINDVLKISSILVLNQKQKIKEWEVEITDVRGKIVKTWSGTDSLGELEFDGKYKDGNSVSSCSDYIVNAKVKISGNKVLQDRKVVRTGIMVTKEDNYLRINIPGIVFDSEGSGFETLTRKQKKENERIFAELSDLLKKYSGYKITIEGHTTNFTGKDGDENEKYIPMTLARAETVKKILVENGVSSVIQCEGKGGTMPVSKGSFAWKNRRMEIRLEK